MSSNTAFYLQLSVTAIGLVWMYRLGYSAGLRRGLSLIIAKALQVRSKDNDSDTP